MYQHNKEKKTMIGENVPESTSRRAAQLGLLPFLIPVTEAGPSEMDVWNISNLPEAGSGDWFSKPPLEIFDFDGNLLYRDYVMDWSSGKELRVRTSGITALIPSVLSLGVNIPLNLEGRLERARKVAQANELNPEVNAKALVCYAYPKLGLQCYDQQGSKFVIDLGDFTILPVSTEPTISPDLITTFSPSLFLNKLTLTVAKERYTGREDKFTDLEGRLEAGESLEPIVSSLREQSTEVTLKEFKLHPQDTPVFCAVATARMILEYYGFQYSQAEIARAMNTASDGTTNDNQIKGYISLGKGLLAVPPLDTTASFSEAQFEIEQGRPFKTGVPGHARACAGFKVEAGAIKSLYIYDPWPPGQGATYWEKWEAITHTNFIYVRRALNT
ncbi:MAG: C39 family peptidase [Microcystis sp. M038S2]|uniref:C39 family peptidase n=1 Tax=unclassified Microcystis TaxID=2643300 RepID=UPI002587EB29|nr:MULTISPECIES: C39 family peptidase [unclassified Microcystis]MCA2685045.1 C39 family peptidase [Microcystis sp. M046S2]MCA2706210.1 C39 family peptidase [Microcystis sp. M038S2]MCA2951927.1 C39 family peptidase [Microcystis sp. M112S1]